MFQGTKEHLQNTLNKLPVKECFDYLYQTLEGKDHYIVKTPNYIMLVCTEEYFTGGTIHSNPPVMWIALYSSSSDLSDQYEEAFMINPNGQARIDTKSQLTINSRAGIDIKIDQLSHYRFFFFEPGPRALEIIQAATDIVRNILAQYPTKEPKPY